MFVCTSAVGQTSGSLRGCIFPLRILDLHVRGRAVDAAGSSHRRQVCGHGRNLDSYYPCSMFASLAAASYAGSSLYHDRVCACTLRDVVYPPDYPPYFQTQLDSHAGGKCRKSDQIVCHPPPLSSVDDVAPVRSWFWRSDSCSFRRALCEPSVEVEMIPRSIC